MARIKITEEEDWKLTRGMKQGPHLSTYGVVTVSIIAIFFLLGILFQYYLFAAFVVFLVVSFLWASKFGLRFVVRRRHYLNRLWREELEIEFSDRVFKVTIGLNKLTLAVADLSSISERNGYYYLCHDAGLNLLIPTSVLTTEEVVHLKNYQSQIVVKDRENRFYRFWSARRLTRRSS
jgi:hypothetical protein